VNYNSQTWMGYWRAMNLKAPFLSCPQSSYKTLQLSGKEVQLLNWQLLITNIWKWLSHH